MHRAERTGVHSCDNRRTRWGTDGKGDKGICVPAALRGEAVKVWRNGVAITITAEVGADVFTAYPEDVWSGESILLRGRLW